MTNLAQLLPEVCAIAREASALILEHYAQPIHHEKKADHSPVTAADRASNDLIVARLRSLTPEIAVVSEEGDQPPPGEKFWLVDPLDGTKSYIARDDEFSVNIALVENRKPILGVLAVPAKHLLYYAIKGGVAYRETPQGMPQIIRCCKAPEDGLTVLTSKSHGSPRMEAFLAAYKVKEKIPSGSAYKLARVAEGSADFYPRLGPTMEWDTAAGHCILEAAGGTLTTLEGAPFVYGKPDYLNGGFLASGAIRSSDHPII
jgi:3'(2'), 5'-bisphosphate nucleotidase